MALKSQLGLVLALWVAAKSWPRRVAGATFSYQADSASANLRSGQGKKKDGGTRSGTLSGKFESQIPALGTGGNL